MRCVAFGGGIPGGAGRLIRARLAGWLASGGDGGVGCCWWWYCASHFGHGSVPQPRSLHTQLKIRNYSLFCVAVVPIESHKRNRRRRGRGWLWWSWSRLTKMLI
ncbi:hypothetical protein IF2G_02513 [Cordyceps javanica]|nr:hypothetical protein IF2G_02513 [Cordyceps javanica]